MKTKLNFIHYSLFFFSIITAYKVWPLWQNSSFSHQPIVMLIFFYLSSSRFIKRVDLRPSPLPFLFLIFILIGFEIILKNQIFFLVWLIAPLKVVLFLLFFLNRPLDQDEKMLVMLYLSCWPFPWPLTRLFAPIMTLGSKYFASFILLPVDLTSHVEGSIIKSMGKSLSIGEKCGGVNGIYVSFSLLIIFSIFQKISLRKLFLVVMLMPISLILFNSLRIATFFIGSTYFFDFEKAIANFHTIGPVFFIPHILLMFLVLQLKFKYEKR